MSKNRFFFVAFLLLASPVFGQLYNFKNFSSADGLPESTINTLLEDVRGNLWIGTSGAGLIRHDGYSFYSYVKEDGLISNVIYSLCEDDAGKLWIGTSEGICTYDGVRFRKVRYLEDESVKLIAFDSLKNLWIATEAGGLYKFNGRNLVSWADTQPWLANNPIHCFYQDKNGNLWIGTSLGAARYDQQQFTFFSSHQGLLPGPVRAITEDRQGNLWLATNSGISRFQGDGFVNYATGNRDVVHALLADQKNNLWLGTSNGILKYNGTTFQGYPVAPGQSANAITCIYSDKQGNLWFGSAEKGLSRLDSERFIHYAENNQLGKNVYGIVQSLNGSIICGTSRGGATYFDGKQFTLLDRREGFTSSIVQCFLYSPDSTLWVGTRDDGLYAFHHDDVARYTVTDGLPSNNISALAIDKKRNIWIATADSGLLAMKPPRDSIEMIRLFNTSNGLPSNKISAVVCDSVGAMWVGSEDRGLTKIFPSKDTVGRYALTYITTRQGLKSDVVHTILSDSLNQLYIGTARGIAVVRANTIYTLTKDDGLASNNIYSLSIDRDNNLWAGTERGVEMITFGENFPAITVQHFGSHEGFQGLEVFRNSTCVDREGNIWFGTINGLIKYNPREEIEPNVAPKIQITGIKLFFTRVETTKYVDSVSAWYAIPARLILPYYENNLTFSFVGIHHRNPQTVRYKWVLEGFSPEWSPVTTEREITVSNLAPGQYTFKVLACNEYNVWNETPAAFTFTIEPPWWQRWWAKVGLAVLLLFMVWIVFRIRINRIKSKNKAVRQQLEMQNSILELEQEAARLQMNPHFIFNCLNSIQGFISNNDAVQAKWYLAKFAKLMRLILENAREEFIPLQHEINILQNYMDLEKLSASNKFDFKIALDDEIDPAIIQIPPMMIQPLVENAILHGVKKKTGPGFIDIRFTLKDDVLTCVIQDNGIGRKQAGQLNEMIGSGHKSTGISVTQKRLAQYSSHRKINAGIEIIDLEEDGNPAGTRVVLTTPFEM